MVVLRQGRREMDRPEMGCAPTESELGKGHSFSSDWLQPISIENLQ